ncbi:MAG: PA14 domain-containing protein, partial [Chloroflexota bacterium]
MGNDPTLWKKGLLAVAAAALFTVGLAIAVYVLVARERISPTPTPRPTQRATSTPLAQPPTATAMPTPSHTAIPAATVVGLVRDYSPGALIIVLQPIEGRAEQVIVPENLEVTWADGSRATPREIAPGQTLYSEGALDALGRLVASRIVITKGAAPTPTLTPTPRPKATATPLAGWLGEYYANPNLEGAPAATRQDAVLDFQWGEGAPLPSLPADNFAIRWRGRFAFKGGSHRFFAFSDDGVRVWLDGKLQINQWRHQSPTLAYADVAVTAGDHDVQVEYFEGVANAQVRVWWSFQGEYPDWRGEYFANLEFTGEPALVRNDPDVAFDWGAASPGAGVPADGFAVRWMRKVPFDEGAYHFYARADDAVRVWIDGVLLIDEWHLNDNLVHDRFIWLEQGPHDVHVEYAELGGDALIRVWWNRIDTFANWQGLYYANPDLKGRPVFGRDDPAINFDWGTASPGYGVPVDNFSVRWTRKVTLAEGEYRFFAFVDDGLRVYVNGKLILNDWRDAAARDVAVTVALPAGTHEIKVEYYERGDGAVIRFGWEQAGTPT